MTEKKEKSGLSDFFNGLNGLIELVSKLQDSGEGVKSHTGEFKTPSGLSGVYGVQIKTGAGGSPVFEQFGNIGKGKEGGLVHEEREPLVDVFEEGDMLTVVAELPGASDQSIALTVDGSTLTIAATARDRKYRKELTLPARVLSEPAKRSHLNGIFSVVLVRESQHAVKA